MPLMRPLVTILSALAVLACSLSAVSAAEVNLYSARKEALIKPLLDQFSKETGVAVNLITAEEDALVKRLVNEGENSPADVLLTTDAGRLFRAKQAGVTQSLQSAAVEAAVPSQYRDPEKHWFGLSLRARPILYVKGKVDPKDLSTYEALADPKWKGRICIRSSGNIYNQSLVASMIAAQGAEKTESWLKGLVANFAAPPKGGDRDQIKAAAAGQCDIAIANTYYLAGMLASADEKAPAEKMGVFWPNQADRGTHVNISGAALTRSAKNRDAAIRLLEFLVSPSAQSWYAQANGEYPVLKGVEESPVLKSWGSFKADTLNLARLGDLNADAVKAMDRAGWK